MQTRPTLLYCCVNFRLPCTVTVHASLQNYVKTNIHLAIEYLFTHIGGGGGFNGGAIVGGIIGALIAVVLIVLIIILVTWLYRLVLPPS